MIVCFTQSFFFLKFPFISVLFPRHKYRGEKSVNIFSKLLFAAGIDLFSQGRIDTNWPVKLGYGRRVRKDILLNA